MKKVYQRLLTFFIGLPLVALIVCSDFLYHLPLHVALTIFAIVGANEMCNMLGKEKAIFSKPVILICVALLPVSCYLFILFDISLELTPWFFIIECIILMGIECFTAKTFENSVTRIANSILIIFYTGFLITFLSRMTILNKSTYMIILFLIFVFMCDSCAWLFGMLFGKNNRGFIAASPNKSIVGFFGGVIGATVCGVVFKFAFNDIITCSYKNLIILGIITTLASIIGDLIESVFKRSCNVKDSGNFIPGRGGALDSIDSVLIALPVFYIGQHFLF